MTYSEFLKSLCSGRRFYYKEGRHIVECVPTGVNVYDTWIELLGYRPDKGDEPVTLLEDCKRIDLGETAEKCAADDCHSLRRDLAIAEETLCGLGVNVDMEHVAFKRYMWDGFMPVSVKCTPYLLGVDKHTITFRMNQTPERSQDHAERLIAVDIATGDVTFNDGLYATGEECAAANSVEVIGFESHAKPEKETEAADDGWMVEPLETPCERPASQSVEAHFRGVLPILKAFSTLLVSHGLKDYTYLGSCALLAAGFPLVREPHDIDVEVLCGKDADALFAKMREIERADGKDDDGYDGQDKDRRAFFKFRFAGWTFNVWTKSPEKGFGDNRRFMSEGLWFSGVGEVLEAKAAYGRYKDRMDAAAMIYMLGETFNIGHMPNDRPGDYVVTIPKKEACDGAEG